MITKAVITINIKKTKQKILLLLIIFFIISLITIYSVSQGNNQTLSKQIIWYLIGFFIIFISSKINCKKILEISPVLYVFINALLLLLLFFGNEVNGSKCWFILPGIGSFQPSEFAKVILILLNAKTLEWFSKKNTKRSFKNDLTIFFIIILITITPSILTFLEPDTGMVIIYFLISLVMLYIFGIRKAIFLIILVLGVLCIISFLYYYFNYEDQFINVFGTSFFYRIDRLLDWSNENGMQLTNAITAIKAAGWFGYGIGNTPIYIPEAHTDFIFSIYSSSFGFIGSLILLILIFLFDFLLFKLAKEAKDKSYRFIIIGFLAMILYQQIQNIGMNLGLLPITGITLPFISYGGSSLISYMLGIAIIINYDNNNKKNKKAFI